MIIEKLILSLLILKSIQLSIFPNYYNTQEIQWEENIWMDCTSLKEITPYNCQNNELKWQECYLVPENGLCLKQNIAISQPGTTNFNFTFDTNSIGQQVAVVINGQAIEQSLSSSTLWISQAITENTISIKIKTSGLILNTLLITTDCSFNCASCKEDHTCENCAADFFQYYFVCIPNSCSDQLGSLSSRSHISTISQIDQATSNYTLLTKFDTQLIKCIVPKVYLTKSITDNTITTILAEDQITLDKNDNTIIKYYLTPQQYQSCQLIDTADSFIYQCFIGVALTMNKQVQYSLLLIGQITVIKSTSAASDTIQAFEMPTSTDTSQIIGPVIVVSDASDTVIDTSNQLVQTTQSTIDPTYSGYTMSFLEGQIIQNNTVIPLTLQDQSQDGSSTDYVLSYSNSQLDQNASYSISVSSTLSENNGGRRRILSSRNVIPQLQISDSVKSSTIVQGQLTISKISSKQKASLLGGVLAAIFLAVVFGSFIFIIGTIMIKEKIRQKYFPVVQQNEQQQQIHTEPEVVHEQQQQA